MSTSKHQLIKIVKTPLILEYFFFKLAALSHENNVIIQLIEMTKNNIHV